MFDETHEQIIKAEGADAYAMFAVVSGLRNLLESTSGISFSARAQQRFIPVILAELTKISSEWSWEWGKPNGESAEDAIRAGAVCAVLRLVNYAEGALDEWLGYEHTCAFHKADDAGK